MARELHYWEYVALEEAELQKKEAELQKSEISEAGLCSQFGQVALVDEEKATSKDKENNPDQITNNGKEDSVSYKTPARSYSPPDRVYNNNCYYSSSSSDRHFSTPTKSYNNSLETPSSLTPEEKDARTKERILQISNFPFSFKRNDFYEVFTTCKNVIFSGHGIALVVFPTKSLAQVAYTKALNVPVLEEFEIAPFTGELPYELKAYAGRDATRPKTSDLVARRLIGKSLGKTIGTEEENRRKQGELDEARRRRVKEREDKRELEKD